MSNQVQVYIKVEDGGRTPEYQSIHAAGCDLYAPEDMVLKPGETKVMPLNFIIAMGQDMEAQIRPRSGLSLKTEIRIPNNPGTIDSDYRNIVGVIMQNTYNIANLPYQIMQDTTILTKMKEEYREISLGDYLLSKNNIATSDYTQLSITQQKVYVDSNGNPYGTIYVKKGERIAQMVFTTFKKAIFIDHKNPESIGHDRGGGFGHSDGK